MAAFLVMLREGVEAALIVAILLAYLVKIARRDETRWVWGGTVAAALISVVAGFIVFNTIGALEGRAEEVTEGVVALVAVGLLTWMIFWMGRQARAIKGHLQGQVDSALAVGGAQALALIAFIAVLREGLESALFLISTTVGEEASGGQLVGGLLGVVAAVGIGYLLYRGSKRLDLRRFFRYTGVLILLFAAGLLAKGIHEFQEASLIATLNEHLYTTTFADPDTSVVGRFLRSLFGWSPAPSLEMVVAYFAYLLPVGWAFWRMTRPAPAAPVTQPAAASQL
jgi:high-affinity iron transporter